VMAPSTITSGIVVGTGVTVGVGSGLAHRQEVPIAPNSTRIIETGTARFILLSPSDSMAGPCSVLATYLIRPDLASGIGLFADGPGLVGAASLIGDRYRSKQADGG
jgi:hypothetical protein